MEHTHDVTTVSPELEVIFVCLALITTGAYLIAVKLSNQKGFIRIWPWQKVIYWILGILIALLVMTGPLAEAVHVNFTLHMLGHLMLGMLSPLLLVLSSPIKLMLRALPVRYARFLTKIMRSRYVQFMTHPVTASILNIGGLWLLYSTSLFQLMHVYTWLYVLVHLHVFFAGYVFTSSMIYIEPVAHRYSYLYRSIVFVFALAAHQILSKFIYAYPPAGVIREQAEAGAMLMYYGGNLVDAIIIFLICLHWYQSTVPRKSIYQVT